MNAEWATLAEEALATGRIRGLPEQHFIAGEFVAAQSGAAMESLDPGTGKAFIRVAAGDKADIDHAVSAAKRPCKAPGDACLRPRAGVFCIAPAR